MSIDLEFHAPSIEELQPHFPAYEITAFIAQGGMGAVYAARQVSLDRPVAIKILPRQFGADPQFRASFESEATTVGAFPAGMFTGGRLARVGRCQRERERVL